MGRMTTLDLSDAPELLTVAQMREADAHAIASGVAGVALMNAAGLAVAREALALLGGAGGRVVVLCGPGANGGDGWVVARLLKDWGIEVAAASLVPPESLAGDAALAARGWSGPWAQAQDQTFEGAALVVDALFGAGLNRDLSGEARAVVERLNLWRAAGSGRVLAVDTPSGLDGDTGQIRGAAVEADVTVTFFRRKPGHLLFPGRRLCGRTVCADIGIPADALDILRPAQVVNTPALWRAALPGPRPEGHKYDRGHVFVLSGEAHRTGAARLAARAALRGGAGLVTVASPRDALVVNAAHLTAVMLAPCDGAAELAALLEDRRTNALVIGPAGGVGESMRACVRAALGSCAPDRSVVLDADALTSFEGAAAALAQAIQACPGRVAMTPHEGEFNRFFNRFSSELDVSVEVDLRSVSKLTRARAAARATGATVVLKGPDTIVAHPDGRASIGADLSPWLATAGSGDVLAGLAAACLARGAPAFEAVSAAVWLHGAAGRACGPGLIAEDLSEAMPKVWAALYGA